MKPLTKPTDLIHSSLSLRVVAVRKDNSQNKFVKITKGNSTVKEAKLTLWKDQLLKRSTSAYANHNNSTDNFLRAKQMNRYEMP